ASLKNLRRIGYVHRLRAVMFLGGEGIDGDRCVAATALARIGLISFVMRVIGQASQQEGAEPAFRGMHGLQAALREQLSQKSLNQIFRVLRTVALAAKE